MAVEQLKESSRDAAAADWQTGIANHDDLLFSLTAESALSAHTNELLRWVLSRDSTDVSREASRPVQLGQQNGVDDSLQVLDAERWNTKTSTSSAASSPLFRLSRSTRLSEVIGRPTSQLDWNCSS